MSNAEPCVPQLLKIAGIEIPVAEQTPLVLALVAVIQRQAEEILALRDEIQRMKGTTMRPKIAPSRLLKPPPPTPLSPPGKRPGSAKRQKTKNLIIKPHTIRYRRAVYRLADGSLQVASRPNDVDSHFGPGLRQLFGDN